MSDSNDRLRLRPEESPGAQHAQASDRRRVGDLEADGGPIAEALRASDERFRGILESAPNAIVVVRADGTIAYVNGRSEQLFGYSRDDLIGMNVDNLVPDELRGLHQTDREAYLRAPATRQMGFGRELEARRRDGTTVPAEIGLSSFVSQGERYVLVVLADITARKQIEAELRSTGETLQALINSSPLATMVLDHDGAVRLWNPAAEHVFGWPAAEVLGRVLPHVPESEIDEVRSILRRAASGEVIAGMEIQRQRRDGHPIQLELYAAPHRDSDGRIVGVIEQMADITSRRHMEEALLQAQKMESIGRLAGGIAHDFNNMLTAISGFAQLLLLDLPGGTEQHESAAAIKRAAEQAAALTQQLLAFSRRQVLQPKVLDPDDVIGAMGPMLRRLIGENIDLRLVRNAAAGRIRADPVQIEQVVLNLAVNARDAMPNGGSLTIETGRSTFDEAYAAEHFAVSPGNYVMIAVSDSGVGMDRATRSHVFEPFFTTKERGRGTGLGLATIYGIVRQSGGHIWLYSEPGHGTTFKIYFPLVEEAVEPEAPAVAAAQGGSETILLVEDEEAVRELARLVLQRQGYDLVIASNANEALELLRSHEGTIDLMVSDVVMPGMSGPELAKRVRDMRPDIRTLFLSGYTEETVTQNGRLSGHDGFLSKPFTPETLARKVRELLGRSSNAPA